MSMNLKCNLVELVQTPTWVTYMCMVRPDGKISHKRVGSKAKQALYCYLEWLYGTNNKAYESTEDAELQRSWVNERAREVLKVIKNKQLEVYIT